MIRGLFQLIGWLIALAMVAFIMTGVWIVYDGTHDDYDHADVALVPGYGEIKDAALPPSLTERLDRAAALYADGKFSTVVVSGVTPIGELDETDAMAHYLEDHKVPASAIIQDHRGENANDTVDNIVSIMQEQKAHSLLLITDYWRLTRLKLVLHHAGLKQFEQAHTGEWKKEDNLDVMHEDVTIYKNLYHWYVLPTATEVKARAKEEEQQLKDKVNNGLDSLHKPAETPAK
jgi:vancomycin permeability regulator SanA